MSDLIHVHIFEPHLPSLFGKSSKNERSQLHLYSCPRASECEAHSKGMCVNVSNACGPKCPLGRKSISEGFTQRATKYYPQIQKWKEEYKEFYHKLTKTPQQAVKVAGGWFLSYPHINMDEALPFHGKSGFMLNGAPYLKDEDFTPEVFARIISQQPMALMGGKIRTYQKDVVPKFCLDLYKNYPEEFEEVANKVARELVGCYDYVGRKAFLKTVVAPCDVVISKKTWRWDGEKITLTGESPAIFDPVSWVDCKTEFTPDDLATIKVTDNAQVGPNTKLAD